MSLSFIYCHQLVCKHQKRCLFTVDNGFQPLITVTKSSVLNVSGVLDPPLDTQIYVLLVLFYFIYLD